jgi:hypothetical protein
VVLVALVVRVGWLLLVPTAPYSDYKSYLAMATRVAEGHDLPQSPWPPGFPYFLVPFVSWFASRAARAAVIALAVLGAATTVPVYRIGALLRGSRTGLGAALLWALWPGLIVFGSCLASDLLFVDLVVTAAWLLLERRSRPWLGPLLGGLGLGLAALVRSTGMPLAVTALVTTLVVDRWVGGLRGARLWRTPLAALAGFALPAWFWMACSSTVYGRVLVTPPALGQNLLIGNNPSSLGEYIGVEGLVHLNAPLPITPTSAPDDDAESLRWAIHFMRQDPSDIALASVRKLGDAFRGEDLLWWSAVDHPAALAGRAPRRTLLDHAARPFGLAIDFFVLVVVVLGAVGLTRRSLWRGDGAILATAFLVQVGMLVLFWPQPRYHLPAVAFLIPMAALEAARFIHSSWDARKRQAIRVGLTGAGIGTLAIVGPLAGGIAAARSHPVLVAPVMNELAALQFTHEGSEPPPGMSYEFGDFNQSFERLAFHCVAPRTACGVTSNLLLPKGRYQIFLLYRIVGGSDQTRLTVQVGDTRSPSAAQPGMAFLTIAVSDASASVPLSLEIADAGTPSAAVLVDQLRVDQMSSSWSSLPVKR